MDSQQKDLLQSEEEQKITEKVQIEQAQKVLQKVDDEDIYHSEEEMSHYFNEVFRECTDLQQGYSDPKLVKYEDILLKLKKLEKSIIQHGVFSTNESLKDIYTEFLKYFLVPFYIGDTFSRISDNRKQNVLYAKTYLNEYLKLLQHYDLLPKMLKRQWKSINEDPKYVPQREDVIANFKEKKNLEKKVQNLEKIKDEEQRREYLLSLIEFQIYEALTTLKSFNEELQILEYKEKINKDNDSKIEHEKIFNQPLPPIKFVHIPKYKQLNEIDEIKEDEDMHDNPYMMNPSNCDKFICQKCQKLDNQELIGKSGQQIKEEFQKRVWQPGFAQPIMRMGDWADAEFNMMQKTDKINKEAQARQVAEDEQDSDKDEVNEKKRVKDSNWDDWKDDHEKGAGNKKR